MIPPVFAVCTASQAVLELLGTAPTRLWPFGLTDEKLAYPYVVWQTIDGAPGNYLGQRPDTDSFITQIDVYGETPASVMAVTRALRDAIEGRAYIVRWGDQTKDPETKRFRMSFDVSWIVRRT